jgi:hypothetical protein
MVFPFCNRDRIDHLGHFTSVAHRVLLSPVY